MKLFAKLTDLPDGHPDIIADMQKRYVGSYVKYKNIAVFVNNISNSGICGFQDKQGNEYTLDIQTEDMNQLEPHLPCSGYYNVNNNPIYLAKRPERQWRRSFGKHIYLALGASEYNQIGADSRFWWNVAQETIQPEYVKLDDLNHRLLCNVAINKEFAVVVIDREPWLCYRRYPVAKLNFKNKTIAVQQDILKQEVKDMLIRNGERTWALL